MEVPEMRGTHRLSILIAVVLFGVMAPENAAMAQTPAAPSWEESLISQYPKGSVLNVRTTGVDGTSGCLMSAKSTFKDGKLHEPGFGQILLLTSLTCVVHALSPGSHVYLGDVQVIPKDNRVAFAVLLCSVGDCSGGVDGALKAEVDFDFAKGFLEHAQYAQVQEAIQHVFALTGDPAATSQGAQVSATVSTPTQPAMPPTLTPGSEYSNAQNNADRLQLHMDHSFALTEGGQSFTGKYSFAGATLTLHIAELQKDVDIVVQGENLVVNGSENWMLEKRGSERPAGVDGAAPSGDHASAIAGKYIFSTGIGQQSDYTEFGDDGKYVLQESGKIYRGRYTVQGDVVTVALPSGRAFKVKLAGDTLVEADGTRLARQGSGATPAAAGLTIDQIIKMAQVKVPDDMIITTIKKSGVKYVLSPDDLIKLKTAGVSDAVIRAMSRP
jgi:hypothetical protein